MRLGKIIGAVLVIVLVLSGCGPKEPEDETLMRVGSLKGPTTMGMVSLMEKSAEGKSAGKYEFTMAVAAEEISAALIDGSLDAALVPANLAAVLYNKTGGGVTVININTLGVLYAVSGDPAVKAIRDFEGKTVLSTGQGTTPEMTLRYLLQAYGVQSCEIEFCSEASEAAAVLQKDPSRIAVLPQPFVTVATQKNPAVKVLFSLSDAWDELENGSRMVTGVTVVRTEYLKEHPGAVRRFLEEHAQSAETVMNDPDASAAWIVKYGIVEKEEIARNALPYCNLVSVSGKEMKTALSGYLQVLFDQNPKSVGGSMPGDDFYYGAE